jgi:hypothetical protein
MNLPDGHGLELAQPSAHRVFRSTSSPPPPARRMWCARSAGVASTSQAVLLRRISACLLSPYRGTGESSSPSGTATTRGGHRWDARLPGGRRRPPPCPRGLRHHPGGLRHAYLPGGCRAGVIPRWAEALELSRSPLVVISSTLPTAVVRSERRATVVLPVARNLRYHWVV